MDCTRTLLLPILLALLLAFPGCGERDALLPPSEAGDSGNAAAPARAPAPGEPGTPARIQSAPETLNAGNPDAAREETLRAILAELRTISGILKRQNSLILGSDFPAVREQYVRLVQDRIDRWNAFRNGDPVNDDDIDDTVEDYQEILSYIERMKSDVAIKTYMAKNNWWHFDEDLLDREMEGK
jgi:hypothetical protein